MCEIESVQGFADWLDIYNRELANQIKESGSVNFKDPETGNSLAHIAILYSCVGAINFLVNNNADLNIRNNLDQTPLHYFFHLIQTNSNLILI